jgi:SAM-dependent methyltransferase
VRVEVILRADGREHPCALQDVSTSGAGFEWPADLRVTRGARLSDLSVVCENQEVYRGDARVHTLRELAGRVIAGVSFLDAPMNMDDVRQLREVREQRSFQQAAIHLEDQPWYCDDPRSHDFEALVGELRLFLVEAEARFDDLERHLPWHVLHGEKATPARQLLIEQLQRGFVPAFVEHSRRIDAALRATAPGQRDRLRAYSRGMLHEYFMRAPLMHRALTKPLGYPGDYVVMRYLYLEPFEGSSLLAKAIHLGGVSTPACDAVRARKDLIRQAICDTARTRAAQGLRTRVLSIAAGPAQETFEAIARAPDLAPWLDVLLFDQDQDALENVDLRLAPVRAAHPDLRVQLRKDTIRRILDDPSFLEAFGPTDLVFSCGLFDYLRFHTGVRLIRHLLRLLAPGGRLFVGNLVPEQPTRWIFDLHLDWFLEYRSREELLSMGEVAAPEEHPFLVEEASGLNPFVCLQRSE